MCGFLRCLKYWIYPFPHPAGLVAVQTLIIPPSANWWDNDLPQQGRRIQRLPALGPRSRVPGDRSRRAGRVAPEEQVEPSEDDEPTEKGSQTRLLRKDQPRKEGGDHRLGENGAGDDRSPNVLERPVQDRVAQKLRP